jgi:peptidyl-prolyl cis-trans isomerase A (cyclophilin A)
MRSAIVSLLLGSGILLAQKNAAPEKAAPQLEPGLYAVINTSMGTITAELFEKATPITVRVFIGLARGGVPWLDPQTRKPVTRPLYQNITFHRVIPDFMIQTGDPTGTGAHNCGFTIKDEIVPTLKFDRPGRLAMANIGRPNTGACQFFITDAPYSSLNGGYTIFGQVVDGQPIVGKIARVVRDSNDKPRLPIRLIDVNIIRVAPAPDLHAPAASGSGFFVNASGDILTSSQAVQGCAEVRLAGGAKLQVAFSDRQNNLALLRSGNKAENFAVFSDAAEISSGEPVFAAGYSMRGSLNVRTGSITAVADRQNDSRFVQLSTQTQPADAGGPLLSSAGSLVGVLLPGDVAIKASVAGGFLESNHVSYRTAPDQGTLDAAQITDAARKYTVELDCFK